MNTIEEEAPLGRRRRPRPCTSGPVPSKGREWIFVYYHLERVGVLGEGFQGVGFGVGTERLPSVFVNLGARVVATDAPAEIGLSSCWTETGQHSDTLNELFYPDLVSKEAYNSKVSHRFCDMNAIDSDLKGFDFTWSCCSFEHLGSLEAGMQFVINSVENTLKPGGVAVHTTEFNLSSNDDTIDSGPTVLYRRRDIEELVLRLEALGNEVTTFRDRLRLPLPGLSRRSSSLLERAAFEDQVWKTRYNVGRYRGQEKAYVAELEAGII